MYFIKFKIFYNAFCSPSHNIGPSLNPLENNFVEIGDFRCLWSMSMSGQPYLWIL